MRPRRCLADSARRRAILEATAATAGADLFGASLTLTRAAAYLPPDTGARSLATVIVPSSQVSFAAAVRAGAIEPDWRVSLPIPDLGMRHLALKDHFLLLRTSGSDNNLEQQAAALKRTVQSLGDQVAVRLGLSRSFPTKEGATAVCWLMADGFFSLTEPQP